MRIFQAASLLPLGISLGLAQAAGFCYCPTGLACSGDTPQCTTDNKGDTICCASGQKAINGKCSPSSNNLCSNGETVCSGATPQCTIDVSVYIDTTGGAASATVCCPIDHKALNGKCYPRNATVMPCYQNNKPCDWRENYYCAWNDGNGDSMCCKLNEYYNGVSCVRKP